MRFRHPVDELAGGGAGAERGLEVGDVTSAFADLAGGGVIRCPRFAVAGDNRLGLKRRYGIERLEPAGAGVLRRSAQPHVRLVVDDVAGDDEAQRGYVNDAGVAGVGRPDRDDRGPRASDRERGPRQRRWRGGLTGQLAGEEAPPDLLVPGRDLP